MNSINKLTTSGMAVLGAIVSVVLQFVIGILPSSGASPPENLRIFFLGLTVLDGIAMGVGFAFIIFSLPKLSNTIPQVQGKLMVIFVALSWGLVSWWIHDYLHIVDFGATLEGLLILEYVFHLTLQIAGILAAAGFYSLLRNTLSNTKVENPVLFGTELTGSRLFGLLLIIVGIPSFILGPIILPSNLAEPTPELEPFFMIIGIFDSLSLVAGLTFVILYLRQLKEVQDDVQNRAFGVFIAIAWSLLSWWPHTRLHLNIGFDWVGILFLDYGFHLTLQSAFYVAAFSFYSLISKELNTSRTDQ